MSKSLVEFAKEYSSAWAVHDPDAIAAMHSDDSVFDLHDVGAPATGIAMASPSQWQASSRASRSAQTAARSYRGM